ncbi:hypothetical protein BIFPSEUDO_02476 [Bifidobacterium pseudocatenulatum DSM 20438 = JCM 1200 = LMG 10505]|uniref:Uncharacterized protein n=1 Tax=Bifidobacterium pseudocatenulatum DSM 20438 = JCM 1200 = LMG 10505 TaxID=547043 RepID=C0BQ36_BIFPS|nr:hypothetical protein BIFPSEUDO_02476 [Bifidobacterium pseudocatenulatum DSM 20438 = JCM 1200 = LMG 10505]
MWCAEASAFRHTTHLSFLLPRISFAGKSSAGYVAGVRLVCVFGPNESFDCSQ